MSYEREHIAIIEPPYVWGARWQRPICGCFLLGGFIPDGKEFDPREMHWTMGSCPEHDHEISVVLETMQTMPPSDEEVGALFTRLLEEQIALTTAIERRTP